MAREQRKRLETIQSELEEVRKPPRRISRLPTSTSPTASGSTESARSGWRPLWEAWGAALEAQGGPGQRGDHHRLREGHERVPEVEPTHRVQGLHPVVREAQARRRATTPFQCQITVESPGWTPRRSSSPGRYCQRQNLVELKGLKPRDYTCSDTEVVDPIEGLCWCSNNCCL